MRRRRPISTLFPYTTLFRSIERARVPVGRAAGPRRAPRIRRTAGARAVAGLGRIALTARSAARRPGVAGRMLAARAAAVALIRSEEHTSELQSHSDLVCRLL